MQQPKPAKLLECACFFWRFSFDHIPTRRHTFSICHVAICHSLNVRFQTRITLAKPTHRHDHTVMDSRRATHAPAFLPGRPSYDLKTGINSQFLASAE